MTKPLSGIRPITVRETLYRFTSHALCLQFRNAFATHFFPHEFGIATKGGCETVIHGIQSNLDFHFNWVVFQLNVTNAFNLVLRGVIFQELHALGGNIIQLIPFVRAFYAFVSPLIYSYNNCDGDVMVIPFAMGIRQGDPLGGPLFAFVHLRALSSTINHFPSCLFPSSANDTHIIGPPPFYLLHMNTFRLHFV
jgi:hypothetical protein